MAACRVTSYAGSPSEPLRCVRAALWQIQFAFKDLKDYNSLRVIKVSLGNSEGGSQQMAHNNTERNRDLLHGSLGDKIILFVLPLAATGILQQLFNAADIAVIGRFVGKNAMAAVGSNSPIIGLLINLFVGISLGANVVIARLIGQRDEEGVSKAIHTAIVVAVLSGLAATVFGEIIVAPLLRLMGVPSEVYDMALLYMRIYLAGMPVILLYNFEAAIFRSHGDTRTPLLCLTTSGLVNVVLNIFFVVALGMTVDGVALATVLSNLLSSMLMFVILTRKEGMLRVEPKKLRVDARILREIFRIGLPAGLQSMIFSLANMSVQSSVNSLGADIMAASSAAQNLEIFSYYVVNSFGQACTTFVGQNYGAGNEKRCRRSILLCLLQGELCTLVMITLILIFAKPLLGIFTRDPVVIEYGTIRMRIIMASHLLSLFIEVVSGAMRGFGQSLVPALISLIGICGIRILWVTLIFSRFPTYSVLMAVYPVSLGITAVVVTVSYLMRRSRIFAELE